MGINNDNKRNLSQNVKFHKYYMYMKILMYITHIYKVIINISDNNINDLMMIESLHIIYFGTFSIRIHDSDSIL